MERGETILCGAGELELDPDTVSEEAGRLYTELQAVIETHGAGVVESLVPVLVWVLEGLASSRAQLREKEDEADREKEERLELLERYQAEKERRRESQERYLELDDQIEQERRTMRGREKERERRERELEKKAREQADQLVALEEQRSGVSRDLSSLKHNNSKLLLAYRDLLDKKKEMEREGHISPLRSGVRSKSSEVSSAKAQSESPVTDQPTNPSTELPSDPSPVGEPATFIHDLISSTPELTQFHGLLGSSTPVRRQSTKDPTDKSGTSLEEEMMEGRIREEGERRKERDEEEGGEKQEEEEEEEEDADSLEWEMRNTDSVFSELSELSQEYVDTVDQGASVRGSANQLEEILSQYEELKHTHELVDAARKALICRVEELTNDRSALKLEVSSLEETVTRLEGRIKEMEEEAKRLRKELEASQPEDSDASLPTALRRFSRSEMARVVMEKNQYKERLFELQEAVKRSQTLRATKEEKLTEERSSVWRRFNRLFGLSKEPLIPPPALAFALSTTPSLAHSPMGSPRLRAVSQTQTEGSPPGSCTFSPRSRRRELYRDVRSHVWGALGKRQLHGWSIPLSHTEESSEPLPDPKDVPVLKQIRMLDQRDATAKLNCAVAITPETSGEATCSVWAVSGPASGSDVTVIDPARSNTVLEQFSLPPTSPVLCVCAVPPAGETPGTVWFGTQEGSVLVHSASATRRRCLQSISLTEGVHSLTYSQGQVIAGLADGTLAFFTHKSGGWDLQSHQVLPVGSTPLQPIRCCLAKGACLWVGYWNRVHVVDIDNRKVEQTFTVSERNEQQVRFLCAAGSGVWTSCRLDPILRLFDCSTGRPLQEVDLTPLVSKTLGPAFLSLSSLQVSSLTVISGRLWVGTGSGAVFSVPLPLTSESASIPYCSLASAQLCYHGHRQAVKFIIAAPGCLNTSDSATVTTSQLVLSGGEGYINFRIGDDANDGAFEGAPLRSERSHMIIWQGPAHSVPSSAL